MSEKLDPSDFLNVATINALNTNDLHVERAATIIREANDNNVEVLLLQEAVTEHKPALIELLKQHGYNYIFFAEPAYHFRENMHNGNVIASKYPITKSFSLMLTSNPQAIHAAVAIINVRGYDVHVLSVHLFWGAANGHIRLHQARLINDYALRAKDGNPDAVIIVGGDFNDEPDADSVRFLRGKKSTEGVQSAFWLDAAVKTEWEKHPTTRPYGEWGVRTAKLVGIIDPLKVPERRIDYLMVHGWVYGRVGMPLNFSLFGTDLYDDIHEVSDHYGLRCSFWLPAQHK